MSPCDECYAAPADGDGLCPSCRAAIRRGRGADREPADEQAATDAEVAAAESAWESWRTAEPI